ncbi:fimbrial assembly protein [Paucibacter aquatile]|uniref:Fimbrial assembly protein n=1 Tax=Kinneretia aquatilis TaxID=2070761 RepID=A0A2N8L2U4_9BURK|nr:MULTISPECIES: PilN domain-containing protein [Roseateles]PND40026.1 fimbrial assembly protein [Paucibacter aquatile]WIV98864.1 PilN domain-containing protein [Paucibacter aquatile]
MILINLLPHREEKRKRRKNAFFAGLGLAALIGVGAVMAGYALIQHMTNDQRTRNQFLSDQIAKLDEQIKDIANLKAEIESLKSRQRAVEDLQSDRNTPVQLLNELARHTPEGVYLTAIRQADKVVTISGIAQTNERVSEFIRNTSRSSDWLERPDLVEIKVANLTTSSRDQKRLFDFSMRVSIKEPVREAAPGAPAKPASAPKS